MPAATPGAGKSDVSLRLVRSFEASPQRVFDAWLDPRQVAAWLGPRAMVASAEVAVLEPRVGGSYRILMHKTDGSTLVVAGVYREIVRPSRLVFTWTWEHEMNETLMTVTIRAAGGGSELTLLHENFPNAERRDGHNAGWTMSLDQLAAMLKAQ